MEAAAAALDAELSANLRQQQRDLQDRLAAASSSVDAATLEARRRELAQVWPGMQERVPGNLGVERQERRSRHSRCAPLLASRPSTCRTAAAVSEGRNL